MVMDQIYHPFMQECADSHLEHKDYDGNRAILCAMRTSPEFAKARYPDADDIDAVNNAVAYAEQEVEKLKVSA